jgi:YHS domain-containing protein
MIPLFSIVVVAAQVPALTCCITGDPVKETDRPVRFAGAVVPLCCGGCSGVLGNDPAGAIKKAGEAGRTVAVFSFDPATGKPIAAKDAKASVSHAGVLYRFADPKAAEAFRAKPTDLVTTLKRESLYCVVMKHPIDAVSKAGGFVDFQGTRYYPCCPNCLGKARSDIASLAANGERAAKPVALRDIKG